MKKDKYELMGKYVVVKSYMKPARKFQAREHLKHDLKTPRIGMVVGYRTVYDGKIHPGSNQSGYSFDVDYSPPWFEVTGKVQVLLVCFWPRYKPVLVKMEDANPNIMTVLNVSDNLRPTSYPFSDKDKEDLRGYAAEMKRDSKGRWIKG